MEPVTKTNLLELLNALPRRLRALGALLFLALAAMSLMVQPAHAVSASYSFVRQWGSLGSGATNFDNPTGITSDGTGIIYVVDRNNKRIKVFDKTGTLLRQIPSSGQLTYSPWGIGYDAGYLFVSDGTSAIYKLNATDGSYAGQINIATRRGFAVGAGKLYVIRHPDGALLHYSTDCALIDASPNAYPGAEGLTLDQGGINLYVVDCYNDRILKLYVYDNSYTVSSVVSTGTGSRPSSVAIDRTYAKLFVTQVGTQTIRVYDAGFSQVLYEWGGEGSSPGKLSGNVAGLALTVVMDDPYVADDGNQRIQQFTEGIHPIPKTGATISRVATDDGAMRLGRAWKAGSFGSDTGLQWLSTEMDCEQCTNLTYCGWNGCCGAGNTLKRFNTRDMTHWSFALEYPVCLNATLFGGYNDWRLPNINELLTLVNRGAEDPGAWLRTNSFAIQSGKYHSSTVSNSNNSEVQGIDFATGFITNIGYETGAYVLPVRTDSNAKPLNPPYRTGQENCFPLPLDGGTVPCPLPVPPIENPVLAMQDGAVKSGIPWPQPRMVDYSILNPAQDYLFDALTGLGWLKNKSFFPCNPWGETGWSDGHQVIDCLNQAAYLGQTNWRMPNISELESLRYLGSIPSVPYGDASYWFLEQGFNFIPFTIWSSTVDPKVYGMDGNNHLLQIDFKSMADRTTLDNLPDQLLPVFGGDPRHGLVINNGAPVTSSQEVVLGVWPPNPEITGLLLSSDNKETWTAPALAGLIPYTLPPVDGVKTVWARYSRPDGSSEDFSASITLDTYAPIIATTPTGGSFNSTQLVTIIATEPGRIYYRTDGTDPSFLDGLPNQTGLSPLPIVIQPISSGTVLKFKGHDAAGNWSPTYTQTYYLDTTPPSGWFGITSNSATSSRTVTLALFATGNATQIRFSEDNGVTRTEPGIYMPTAMFTFTTPGDGSKCLSVQFMDEATNWSAWTPQQCVNLDTVPPQVAVSHTNVWYSAPVSVTLTCSDQQASGCSSTCIPSGCSGILYTTDGSAPNIYSPYFVGNGTLLVSTDTDLRYVGIDNAGNVIPGPFPVQQYRFEAIPPTVGIASPAQAARLPSLPSVSGTADDIGGSGLSRVEIRITDGTNYVKSDQTFGPGQTWIPLNQANGGLDIYGNWSFATSSVPWAKPGTYTITARAYDNAGNESSLATRSFSIWNSANSVVSFTLSSQSVKNNGSVSIITGKLTRLPDDPAYDLSGLPLTVTVTDPPEYGAPQTTEPVTIYTSDSAGHFTLSGITGVGGFRLEGTYTVTVSFAGTPVSTPVLAASSASVPVMVGSTAGYVIIVEGKLKDDPDRTTSAPYHNLSHSKTAQRVFEALKARGFADADIYNLNYDSTKTGVDAPPDKALIQTLLTATGPTYGAGPFNGQSTIFTKMVNNPGPLYLVLVDHGDPGNFYIDTDSATVTISASELDQWLDTLETALAPFTMAAGQKRIIINGSCYSGSFIPVLSKEGRVIIASAAATEQSFKGGMESDNVRSGEFFLEEFFGRLRVGDSFKASFDYASDKVRTYTRSGSANSATAPYFDDAIQHPLLDDDASGSGSNSLSTVTGDGIIAAGIRLGFSSDTTNAGSPAAITSVSDTDILDTETSATLRLTTADFSQTLGAWIEVRKPSQTLAGNGEKRQLDPTSFNITRTGMSGVDPNTGIIGDEYFTVTYNGFTESGMYEIFYYAQESVSGQPGDISPMKRSVVYKNIAGNTAPTPFTLLSPASQLTPGLPTNSIIFDWSDSSASTVAPGNRVTYTLEIATDSGFGTIVYRKEEIVGSSAFVGASAGLKDLTVYYWRVRAIDSYGASTLATNAPFTFKTDNTNLGNYGGVTGKSYDRVTSAPISGTTVRIATVGLTLYNNSCVTDGTGQCTMLADAGVTFSLEASKNGYQTMSSSTKASATAPVTVTFPLAGASQQLLKIGSNYYDDLSTAYGAAGSGSTIQLRAQTFAGPFSFNRAVAVTLEGGYDAVYSATRTGYTELTGPVIINGTTGCQITMDRVVVR